MCSEGKQCSNYECDVRFDTDRAPYVWLGNGKGSETYFGRALAKMTDDERKEFAFRINRAIRSRYTYVKLNGFSYDICLESFYDLKPGDYPAVSVKENYDAVPARPQKDRQHRSGQNRGRHREYS